MARLEKTISNPWRHDKYRNSSQVLDWFHLNKVFVSFGRYLFRLFWMSVFMDSGANFGLRFKKAFRCFFLAEKGAHREQTNFSNNHVVKKISWKTQIRRMHILNLRKMSNEASLKRPSYKEDNCWKVINLRVQLWSIPKISRSWNIFFVLA